MELSNKILSDITVYMKYAKYLPNKNRRETWEELVSRNKEMHQKKYPKIKDEIEEVYKMVYEKKILPSMRSLQFGGKPIEISPNRVYNCAYLPIDHVDAFSETMFLLLGGTGVGFSVQKHHVDTLPEIRKPNPKRSRRYLIGDSIEGWADAIKVLVDEHLARKAREKGKKLIGNMERIMREFPDKIKEVRGKGLLTAFEMFNEKHLDGHAVSVGLLDKGVYAKETHHTTVRIAPALTITNNQIDILSDSIREVVKGL